MVQVDYQLNTAAMVAFANAYKAGVVEGLATYGNMVVELASQLAPKDSGDLSLAGRSSVEGDTLHITWGEDLPDDRATAQEYGTIYMPAQPYLSVALKEIDVVEEVAKAIRSKL
jgi:hypothetical protein